MECRLCGSKKFRVSRLRLPDLFKLLSLRYPVRCRTCYRRVFVSFFAARAIRRENHLRHEEERRRRMQEASTVRQI
jgi:hypothetical protein